MTSPRVGSLQRLVGGNGVEGQGTLWWLRVKGVGGVGGSKDDDR